jgi:hypothetical protein
MLTEQCSESLKVPGQMLLGQPVDGVLHGVGGKHAAVVTFDMGRLDIALEQHLDRQIEEIVPRVRPKDLRHPYI